MANEENRSVNEVVLNGESIISTRKDTVAEDNLVRNESATDKAGKKIKGELDVASADDTYNINDPVDDIEDEDYIPFNDVSDVEMPKKKTLFSSFIEKLTNYFLPAKSIGGRSQLKFNDSGVLDLQLNDIDASKTNNNVTSTHYPTTSNVLDKARRIIMRTEAVVSPSGGIGWKAYVRNYNTSGEYVGQKGIQFHMGKSGNLTYQIDDARAFREAIGTMDVQGSALPSGTVIDDYHTSAYTGVYYFADDGVAGNITTLPEAICGKLIVANNGNGGFTQYYLPNHSVKFWIRVWWSNTWTAWTDIVHNHTYDVGAEIPVNADLNTYTTEGVYQCELTNTARTLSNTPYTGNYMYAFKLIVMALRNSTNKIQFFIPYSNSNDCIISYRFTDNNGSTWTNWQSTAKVYGEANSRPIVTMVVSASNNKRGLLRFNQVENHLRHNFNDGTSWATEQTLANIDDISPSEIGLGYALATISGSAITATITGFKLRAGVIVSIKINNEMSTACTLNINNTGAKNIKFWGDENPSFGKFIGGGKITTFIYDGTYYRVISFDRTPSVSAQSYVADTSGTVLLDWGYGVNRAQIKHSISNDKLAWNYYKNSAWRGDVTIADYDDMNPAIAKVGKSILPSWSMTSNVYTHNGITYTFNPSTGEITANGTATNNSVCIIAGKDFSQYWIPKGTYTLSGCPSGGSGSTYRLILDFASGSKADYGSGNTFTLTSDQKSTNNEHLYIRIESGQTVSNIVFKPMLRPAWTSADYEPCEDIYKGNCYVGTCTTAAGTKDKVAYVDGYFVLRKGVRVAIKFSNSNTYSSSTSNPVTLNVNGTGAKNIWYQTTHSGAGNTGTSTWIYGEANRYMTYVYDGTYWVWEAHGGDSNTTYGVVSKTANGLCPQLPNETTTTKFLRQDGTWKDAAAILNNSYISGDSGWYGLDIYRSDVNKGDRAQLKVYAPSNKLTYNFCINGTWKGDGAIFNRWFPNVAYCTSSTEAGTAAKVATTQGNGTLANNLLVGMIVCVVHTNNNTASNCTLNIDGTGAKQIYYNQGVFTGSTDWICGRQNMAIYYMYDGTYWRWMNMGRMDNSTNFLRNDASSTLTASGSPYINVKSSSIDITQANNGVTTTQYPAYIIQDKNGKDMSRLECVVETNGMISTYLQVRNYKTSDGTNRNGGIKVYMDKSGNVTYWLSNPHKFNAATGIGYGTCSTAADQRVKVVTLSNFVLTVGGIIGVKFSNTNTYSATADNKICLNVNGTGEKPIYYSTGYPTGTNTNAFGYANKVNYYMYDGSNWVWLSHSQDNDGNNRKSFYGTCTTAADQQIKVVSLADTNGWELRAGTIVGVRFSNTNSFSSQTSTPVQLNVNNTGAKNIWYGATHSGAGNTGTNTRIYGEANRVFTYMYDGTYWVWLNCGYEADTVDPRSLGFGYGTCETAESTTAKVVTLGSYNLRVGGYVTVWFKYNVPASATMNINSKGAKNIYYRGSAITAYQIKAGDLATFIYDGTRYHLIGVDRDNYLKINYSYADSTGTPSSSYVTEKVSEVKLPEFKYVVEGDVVCLSVALWWESATTYPSGSTKLFKLNYAPRQLMFWLSDKSNVKGYINTDGTFYIRGATINAGTYAYVQITYLKA